MVFGRDSIDISVSADYDGDNIADLAVRRPDTFTWYIHNSSGSNINSSRLDGIQRVIFGSNAEDIPAVVDYDGNGIVDVAVRRSSNNTFYIENSTGTDFNSVREDDIQRILFGDLASYYPLAAEPYYLANAVMFASATTPGGDITIELPDGIVTYSESLDFISGDLQIYLSFEVNFDNKIADNGQISVLDVDENEYYLLAQEHTPEQLIAYYKDTPLEFEPGSKWSYSNSNYPLLGAALEKVTGMSLKDYLKTFLFQPLQMNILLNL